MRLLLAALADCGPASKTAWAVRSGIPRNHLMDAVGECERLGGVRVEVRSEGLVLWVLPAEGWRVTSIIERAEWLAAWGPGGQARLDLSSERADLFEAMAVNPPPESGGKQPPTTGIRNPNHRNPVVACTRDPDRVLEKKIDPSRVTRSIDRGAPESGGAGGAVDAGDRLWLLEALARMPRLEQEVLRPRDGKQERVGRLFWELAETDPDWLKGQLGDLRDRNDVRNKAAYFNRAAGERLKMNHEPKDER